MTRDEAIAAARQRNAAAASGAGFWAAQERDGAWEVVAVQVGGVTPTRPVGSHTEARPRGIQDDPRPLLFKNVPPYGAA